MSSNIFVDIGSSSDLSPDEISSILASLNNGGIVELSSYFSPYLSLFSVPLLDSDSKCLRYYDSKPPSSNCANVNISPVCYFEDVAYGMYNTSGRIAIASEYGCDVYTKALGKLSSKITSYEDTILCLCKT